MVGNKFWMKIRDMAFDKDGKEGKPKICCHFNIEAQWSKINKIHPEIHQPISKHFETFFCNLSTNSLIFNMLMKSRSLNSEYLSRWKRKPISLWYKTPCWTIRFFFSVLNSWKKTLCNILLQNCWFRIKSLRLHLMSMLFEINNTYCSYLHTMP